MPGLLCKFTSNLQARQEVWKSWHAVLCFIENENVSWPLLFSSGTLLKARISRILFWGFAAHMNQLGIFTETKLLPYWSSVVSPKKGVRAFYCYNESREFCWVVQNIQFCQAIHAVVDCQAHHRTVENILKSWLFLFAFYLNIETSTAYRPETKCWGRTTLILYTIRAQLIYG